jgi:hypothetical protein
MHYNITHNVKLKDRWVPEKVTVTVLITIAIHQFYGYIKFGAPLVLCCNNRLIPTLGFSFTLAYLTFIAHTLYHSITLKHTLILDIFSYLQIHITLQCGLPKWCWSWKWVRLSPSSNVKWGLNIKSTKKGRH